MIWEKNVQTLVMLTRCNEQGRVSNNTHTHTQCLAATYVGTLCPSPQCCRTRTKSVIHDDDVIEISIEKTLLTLFIFCFVSFFGNCTENISIGKGQKRTKLAITLHFTVGGYQR